MSKRELVNQIIETLRLPNDLNTVFVIEEKLNEVIDKVGGSTKEKY